MKKTMKHNLIAAGAAALLTHAATAQVPPPPVSPTPVATYEYDAEGNPTKVTKDPSSLNLQNKASYDAQYRVKELTDPKSGRTAIEYDGGGRPTKVTDPRNLVTQYPRNGFGDATQLISPDTGITNITYDSARNLKTLTDSRGVTQAYTYDELNRPTSLVYTQSGQASQTVTWSWDLTGPDYTYSIGRLSRVDHPSGFARFRYDPRGRITEAVQSVNAKAGANTAPIQTTVKYAYSHGDLMTITYPSGRVLVITRDTGELIAMSLAKDAGSTPVPLISNVKWEPFGPVSGWDWHMASGLVNHTRQFDLSGRIVRYPLGNVLRDLTYDAADRISGFTHLLATDGTPQIALDQSFDYDENSRLTNITTAASTWSIAYDPNGNRASVSLNGSPSTYTTEATSNRLTSITNPARSFGYDNAGNTTSDSTNYMAVYGLNGSIASITKAGVTGSYDYDAERRRIRKVTSTGETVIFVYDLEGQLLGEYDQTGKALREYVWLDNIPVAMFTPDPGNASGPPLIYYIHADHLNAPRIVVDQTGAKRWRWLAEPFGTTAPETNPDGLGTFTQNLRFPGQYADAESGLWYNHFRFYTPHGGSYQQSDPIGLQGGINTYAYVEGNPLSFVDPTGECPWCIAAVVGGAIDLAVQLYENGGNLKCVNLAQVGVAAVSSAGLGIVGRYAANGLLAKTFFNSNFRAFSGPYWRMMGGAFNQWYGVGNLDHWLISQARAKVAGPLVRGMANSGLNLVEIPAALNHAIGMGGWMNPIAQGWARRAVSSMIPLTAGAGFVAGKQLADAATEECECRK